MAEGLLRHDAGDRFTVERGNPADFCTRRAVFRRQPKKIDNLIQRKSQIPAPPHEVQPPYMLLTIDTIVAGASRRRCQYADLLVKTDRHDLNASFFGKPANVQFSAHLWLTL